MSYSPKNARLTEGPVGKTLIKLTIPMIFGMVGMVAFNLADTYFVGKIGALELAALSYTFPVVFVIASLALGLGMGTSAVISRAIGEGNHQKVQRLTTDSLLLGISLVVCFVIAGLLTIKPLFSLLGASAEVLPLIRKYMTLWYIGMPFVVVPMVGNNAIRATGDTKTPSMIMMTAAGINFVLDPILIFGLGPFPKLGIEGAALATVFARFTTFSFALWVLGKRDKMITFVKPKFSEVTASWKAILFIGGPLASSRMIVPVTTGFVTRILSGYGTEPVAGFGVSSRIEFFALAVIFALSAIFGPFIGQNLGAGKIDRIKRSIFLSMRFSILWGIILLILFLVSGKFIGQIFNKDPQVIKTIVYYFSIVPFAYGLQGILVLSNTALNVMHKPYHAAGLIFVQMFVFYIPLAYLGSHFWQIKGIFVATAISYALAGIVSSFVLSHQTKLLEQRSEVH
jgi:MATE family, multidrug efflux pump